MVLHRLVLGNYVCMHDEARVMQIKRQQLSQPAPALDHSSQYTILTTKQLSVCFRLNSRNLRNLCDERKDGH